MKMMLVRMALIMMASDYDVGQDGDDDDGSDDDVGQDGVDNNG